MKLFWRENRSAFFRTGLALSLAGGETVAFAVPEAATLWRPLCVLTAFLALVAYGWGLRYAVFPLVFLVGAALAMRTVCVRNGTAEQMWNAMPGGVPHRHRFVVEDVLEPRSGKKGWSTSFLSHAGDLPVRVVLPIRKDGAFPATGETWECSGWPGRSASEGDALRRRTFWVTKAEDARCLPERRRTLETVMAGWRRSLANCATVGLERCPELSGLGAAILFGERTSVPKDDRETFRTAGTVHVFAISGLHVMMVAGLVLKVLACAGAGPKVRAFVVLPAITIYVLLTGARPSAVRAALMAAFSLGAVLAGRRPDMLSGWSYAALLVLTVDPALVRDTGCLLSFTVMLGIALWLVVVKDRSEVPVPGNMLGVSFAAWVAGVPIAAHVFERFTAGGLVANIVVIPLAAFTVQCGLLGVLFSRVCPPLGLLFNNLAAGGIWGMKETSGIVASWPGSTLAVPSWPLWVCFAWYAAWTAALAAFPLFGKRRSP